MDKMILAMRRTDIAEAMQGLCTALGLLALVRDEFELRVEEGKLAADTPALVDLRRTCEHLTRAAVTVPNACWHELVHARSVGGHELKSLLQDLVSNNQAIPERTQPA